MPGVLSKSKSTSKPSWAAIVRSTVAPPVPALPAAPPTPSAPAAGAGMPVTGNYLYQGSWDLPWHKRRYGPELAFRNAGYLDFTARQHPAFMSILQSLLETHGGCKVAFELNRNGAVFNLTLHFTAPSWYYGGLWAKRPITTPSKTVSFSFGEPVSTGHVALALSALKRNDVAAKTSRAELIEKLRERLFDEGLLSGACGL